MNSPRDATVTGCSSLCTLHFSQIKSKSYGQSRMPMSFFSPATCPFGSNKLNENAWQNPHAFTVHGVAFNGARRARGVQVDPLATATLWNVECTYRKHSLEDRPRSNMDSDSSEQQCKGLTKCDCYHCNYFEKLPLCVCALPLPLSRFKEKLEHATQNPRSCLLLACLSQPPHAFTAR